MPLIKKFILTHEPDIVPAAEEICAIERGIKPRGKVCIAAIVNQKVIAILYINDVNILFPYWQTEISAYILQAIGQDSTVKTYLATVHAITGRSEVVEQLSAFMAANINSKKHIKRVEYSLMILERHNAPKQHTTVKKPYLLRVEQATIRHILRILPLHTEYLREEVNMDHAPTMNHRYTLHYLRDSLKRHTHYIAWYGMRIVAKANSNAEGYACAQLGGIFTHREYRNRGIGYQCITQLCTMLFSRYRSLVLFVKWENTTAISLYKRVGFRQRGSYTIHYLS